MICEEMHKSDNPHIVVHAPAEMLKCTICGREYFSRGKYDPGYCRICEQEMIDKKLTGEVLNK